MASATSRALELLELLESAGTRTVGELADRLGIDERSVRRHIERLREIGIPVDAVRGRGGGYRIAASYRLPPLMLSDEEAVAVLAGLTVARGAAHQLSESSAMATAIAKIRRSLPRALAERLAALLDVVVGTPTTADEVEPSILLGAADAIRSRRPIAMTYRSAENTSRRSVQPHDLVAYNGRWYLTGLDSKTRENRTFRLDRIAALRALDGTFPAPAAHDAIADLVRGFATADYRHTVRLRIQATADQIERHLPASVARLDTMPSSPDGKPWFRVTIRAESLEWLPRTLLALERPVIVDEPEELRKTLMAQAESLILIATART
jgi:predicted DNA-binding transcriptional regulator YafY